MKTTINIASLRFNNSGIREAKMGEISIWDDEWRSKENTAKCAKVPLPVIGDQGEAETLYLPRSENASEHTRCWEFHFAGRWRPIHPIVHAVLIEEDSSIQPNNRSPCNEWYEWSVWDALGVTLETFELGRVVEWEWYAVNHAWVYSYYCC